MNGKRLTQRGADTPHRCIALTERKLCNSLHTRVLFATLLACCLFTLPARAGQTSTYCFLPNKSTITQTGGIAGIHRTYTITGTFQLTADFEAGTATFDQVDANAVDDSPERHTLDPNEVFNMTKLAGVIVDRITIRFEGTADDGSSVLITLTFADDTVTLKGGTTPPPNSADFFVFDMDAVAQRKYSGGTGEPNDPYQIATAADLIALGETPEDYDKHFILTADIDLDPNLPGRRVFNKAVIAPTSYSETPFTGVFDGNSHAISHLTIRSGGFSGLFGALGAGAVVRRLAVVDVNIAGSGDWVGGLAGGSWGGSVDQCYSTGVVDGVACVGGLMGGSDNAATMTRCYSTGTVRGQWYVGGLVAFSNGRVTECYSAAAVDGSGYVGGLVGSNGGNIISSYSRGSVRGADRVGGLVGHNRDSISSSFWDVQASGQATSDGGMGKTTAEMQTSITFLEAGWDFVGETANGTEDIWWILEGKDYPRLSWQLPADDFEDGKPEPLWFAYEPAPEAVQLREINGRLEVEAIAQSDNVDALYVADGWRLDVTKGFAIQVDFHFSKQGEGDGRVTLGVVPSLDPSAMQWAELEAGCFDTGPFYLYEVRDGSWVQEVVADRSSENGMLYMSYDPDTDELYFSHTGHGKAKAWQAVTGLLKGRWASQPVYVILGGGSEGMALAGEDAWLDNFAVSSGALILN